jgi:hypothetical protein
MSQDHHISFSKGYDLVSIVYLTLIGIIWFIAIILAGLGFNWTVIALSAVCELISLTIIRKIASSERDLATSQVLKLQIHTLIEVSLNFFLMLAVAYGFHFFLLSNEPNYAKDLPVIFDVLSKSDSLYSIIFVLILLPITSLCFTLARIHAMYSKGVQLQEFIQQEFNQTKIICPANKSTFIKRLNHYLNELETKRICLSYQLMNAPVTITRPASTTDEEVVWLRWDTCPVAVCLRIKAVTSNTTQITASYQLRNGLYSWLTIANPVTVESQKKYMESNVFQLLRSELVLTDAIDKQNDLRLQAAETQLRILQAQIEPHFLFNTLANVRHLYRSDTVAGEDMMDHLISYLRSAMEDLRCESSSVSKEMNLALHYLAIMKIRMGERLSYSFIIGDSLGDAEFPPAMLISLVENAIKHGLHNKEDGKLIISAQRENEQLRVTVEDNGAGFSSVGGTGVGLSNIRQRLEGMYGNKAWLEVGALNSGGFMSSIIVPLASSNQ